jgi:hypothetical protein
MTISQLSKRGGLSIACLVGATVCFPIASNAAVISQAFTPGWDINSFPLNYGTSSVSYDQPALTPNQLQITYNLNGANANYTYQVGVHIFGLNFGSTGLASFGQYATAGTPIQITRQGNTAYVQGVEFGNVTTNATGNGSSSFSISNLLPGTYQLEFDVRQGVGCNIPPGNPSNCAVVYQSPGPFAVNPSTFIVPVSTTAVPEPFTIVGTLIGGTTAFRMRKKFKATNKL